MAGPLLIVGTESDNPFALDIAAACEQTVDIADILSLKVFANTEFCPRFISDEHDLAEIGNKLAGATVAIVTTSSNTLSRNELAWRNLLVARAARDNGAARVVLIEPDLFFSAQDRGPRPSHGQTEFVRDTADYKKFDGQPFTSRFYAQAMLLAGIDTVITVHNHSASVQALFREVMPGGLANLDPAELFADYVLHSTVAPCLHSGAGLLVCAPDKGARGFAAGIHAALQAGCAPALAEQVQLIQLAKQRSGERKVSICVDEQSPTPLARVAGRDVIVVDDMVRTGTTIKECCHLLKEAGAARVVFLVTHFYPSQEGRENLNTPDIDEIITTSTLPAVLNRDMQGRLRRKLTVLKIGRWMAQRTLEHLGADASVTAGAPLYTVDMSSKNPRWAATLAATCLAV